MKTKCPRGYSDREPSAVREYENGFFCTCVIPDDMAPPSGAPGDIIKQCFLTHTKKAVKDDTYRPNKDEMAWFTPDEALTMAHLLLAAVYDWMDKEKLPDIFRSDAKYYKLKKGLAQARR